MYRVLIVDDEAEIRLGLRLKVNWEALGMRVVGEAGHGGEAVERLESEPVDIVITDMNMPVMDGLYFLDYCRAEHPSLRLIVITGYEDFQYAHAAIRNRVRDYLLKPVTRDELTAALQRIRQELDGERHSRAEASALHWQLEQYTREMKEHLIVRLVRGELDQAQPDAVLEPARRFGLEAWSAAEVRFLTVGLSTAAEAPERTPEQFRLALELLCREIAERWQAERGPDSDHTARIAMRLEVYRDADAPGLMHLILVGSAEQAERLGAVLRDEIGRYLRLEVHVGVSEAVQGFGAWRDGHLSSLIAWRMAAGDVAIGEGGDIGGQTATALIPEETIKVLRRYLSRGELEPLRFAMTETLEEAHAASRAGFVKLIFQLYLLLESAAAEAGVTLESRQQLWLRPERALSLDSTAQAAAFLMEIATRISEHAEQTGSDAEQSVIEAARQFIEDNYRYDLNLTMIAERFNYHPSYFSEFFKAKVGRTFIQYLTDVRMAEAVRLLKETTLSLWDIAEFTGFSNASYFSAKFKKVHGVSPSEYRSGL
ncbi:response regulator transcription factor [Paenibacillus sp. 598K]|uniref:response regulator transcription factor n=1 Tax=Paenibacillus sp. 598K TaxID=1117987 RepID=UPI000FFEBD5C|nr:response regulator [Paenibacillus sp. 598K]